MLTWKVSEPEEGSAGSNPAGSMMFNYEAVIDNHSEWQRLRRCGFITKAMMDIWEDLQDIDTLKTPADISFEARLDSWVDTMRDIRGLPDTGR